MARPGARATERSIGGMPPQPAKDRAPRQPHIQTPEEPQDAGHPHSCTAHPPSRTAHPHRTKQAGQPLHQSEATSKSTLHTARRLPNRWTGSQPEACAASTKSVAPPQKKEQTSRPSATRIHHTKEGT
ncbi:hypothetical protein CRENBAI_026468 [Crenichthys baileyi]|uniref:Uncharacterized protein n=1 Tax=Crenichthys baileyi TaxID=28760 RepID=A0AAV9R3I5_9TELE